MIAGGYLEVVLGPLPPHGARVTAAPPRFAGVGTFPAWAFAAVADERRSN